MNENNANFTPAAPNFKTLVRMSFQGLTNFPYIEEDFDALTNYELLSKVVEYLNQVISNNNEQNELMTNLYNAYVSLQDYVNNYFNNLDVQAEINNKLDSMAQSGELTLLIKNYVDPIYQAYEDEINATIEIQNAALTTLNSKIDLATTNTPIPVSSTSDMTDTTKVYLNTTNGYWYYYDGDSWEQGGVYEAASYESELASVRENLTYDKSGAFSVYANTSTYSGYGQDINLDKDQKVTFGIITENADVSYFSVILTKTDNTVTLLQTIPNNTMWKYKLPADIKKVQYSVATTSTIDTSSVIPILKVNGKMTEDVETDHQIINDEICEIYTIEDFTETAHSASLQNFTIMGNFDKDNILKFKTNSADTTHVTSFNVIYYREDDTFTYETGLSLDTDYERELSDDFVKIVFSFQVTQVVTMYNFSIDLKQLVGLYKLAYINNKNINSLNASSLYNSKILIMGDSISTDYYGNYQKWVTDLIDLGTFDSDNVTNNSIHATGFVATYQTNDDFNTRLQAVQNKSSYDLVVTFGGVNDFIQNIAWSDFTTAVDNYFSYLVNNFTQARLCVLLPLKTANISTNTTGKYLSDYVNYIKEKAKYYSLPVLNLFDESGFCPYIQSFREMWTFYYEPTQTYDGVHPTAEYESKYLAPMIKGFLQDKIYK